MSQEQLFRLAASDLHEAIARALAAFRSAGGSTDLPDRFCEAFAACPENLPYLFLPPEAARIHEELAQRGQDQLAVALNRYALFRLAEASWRTLRGTPRLGVVLPWFEDAVQRMLQDVFTLPDSQIHVHHEPFLKDLGVATLRLWPLGAVTVEPRLKVPRRWMLQVDPSNFVRGVVTLARMRGSFPLYEMHAYTRQIFEFTEAGWDACYRRMARIMIHEPEVKGVYGGTWFWDPVLARISPRLAYLRRLPIEHGAMFARIPDSPATVADALFKSETRRRLHAEGRYQPHQFIMIWPRARFLRWAATTSPMRQTTGVDGPRAT